MSMEDRDIINYVLACRSEADEAKTERMDMNKENYDTFFLRHDFSHKEDGQSTERLSRQSMAVETIKSFFQQALADVGDWWKAECRYPLDERTLKIRPEEITKITNYKLEQSNYFSHVGNSVQAALLGSLAISKICTKNIPKPIYVAKKKGRGKKLKRWVEMQEKTTLGLSFEVIRHENYYPDPSGRGLYKVEDLWMDYADVKALSQGDDAIYSAKAIENVRIGTADAEDEFNKARETGQNTTHSGHRPKVKITEFWGDIINKTTGAIEMKNAVVTIANDSVLLRKESNPLWHQKDPITSSPLYEVANSVWHRAPMDAPTQHNKAITEIYNLMVDAAMKQVHAVSQLRKDALDNPAQVADGIKAGAVLLTNNRLPVGGKLMEPLTQVTIPPEAMNMLNVMSQEFNSSALTNDLRQGVMPFRAVKATEVVEASQTITSVFQGIAKNFESRHIVPELELAWQTIAQNWDKISKEEFITLFGPERGEELSQLPPEEVFANTVNGIKFRVFGVSLTLSKATDFRKLTTLLQTVGSSPILMEEYMRKYDIGKLLGEIMTALNIDKNKLEIPMSVQNTMPGPDAGQEQGPDQMSQIPQAGAGSLQDLMGGGAGLPQTQFPGSPATAGQ